MPLDVRELSLAEGSFRLGEWVVEPRLNRLTRGDESVQIELKVMDVLVCLAEQAGELVERQQLIDTVWATEFISESLVSHAVSALRNVLGEDSKNPTFIETIHRKGYRLLIEPELVDSPRHAGRRWLRPVFIAMTMAILAIAAGLWMLSERSVLEETDTILLTDFVNRTGDPIFDGTLKQALAVKLEESPFLNVISEKRVLETLQLMDRDPDEGLIPDLGHEVCQRLNLKAMITGEIAPLGSHYVITLNTIECRSGDSLARAQAEAPAKEDLLVAMDHATADLRRKLGESLRSIEDYDTPLAIAATPSLEALKSYSIAQSLMTGGKWHEAVAHSRRAIELDPTFASAYCQMAKLSINLRSGRDETRKWFIEAFTHRDRASEYGRLFIDHYYYRSATGDYDKAIEALHIMNDLYPASKAKTLNTLANIYEALGRYEEALDLREEQLDLMPDHALSYSQLAFTYRNLNRIEDAEQVIAAGLANGFDFITMRSAIYQIARRKGDTTTMEEQIRWSSGGPYEGRMLGLSSGTARSKGQFRECREIVQRSRYVAERFDSWATHGSTLAALALSEAQVGLVESTIEDADTALALPQDLSTTATAAKALAISGEVERAEELADQLEQTWPLHTIVNSIHVPAIRAEIALATGDPDTAIELLRNKMPLERRWRSVIDIRGRALLASGSAAEAAAEFRRYLELRPHRSRANLWLGHAVAAAGNVEDAIECYETFLDLWKDADPDIPLLLEARAEYQRLVTTP
jgi:DNA-binding winged helix-turn-helix (wHTH) protein/tetratricopeptide (TPR) repeat protein